VAEGEYIQVIDVEGRQCSDFLAFNARKLQQGIERGLEVTTTRTLNGMAYPGPGLYAKFFDPDMQPLVELVRDTVGRHDAFALACTAKYYEDMGYPDIQTAPTTSMVRWSRLAWPRGAVAGHQLFLQHHPRCG
jgi:aminomethyltransferase